MYEAGYGNMIPIAPYISHINLDNVDYIEALAAKDTKLRKHYRRIEQFAPKTGIVRLLRLTEKQYQNIYMVSGETDYQEKTVGSNYHIML